MKRNVTFRICRNTLILSMIYVVWEYRMLQLVSEQVGPSGQVDESCSFVYQLIYYYVSY